MAEPQVLVALVAAALDSKELPVLLARRIRAVAAAAAIKPTAAVLVGLAL